MTDERPEGNAESSTVALRAPQRIAGAGIKRGDRNEEQKLDGEKMVEIQTSADVIVF